MQPYFELQRSVDLHQWQPIVERQRAATATPGQLLGVTMGTDEPHAFYRLLSIQPRDIAKLGTGGAEVFGYGDAFAQELNRIGQISPEEFAAMFPTTTNYLSAISWDPTTAPFWKEFNLDPEKVNAGKNPDQPGYRFFDNRLSPDEMALFKKNGFVVSERLGMRSFADAFYRLWKDDLPVFISTDALLQAWHRTYDAMLEDLAEAAGRLTEQALAERQGDTTELTVEGFDAGGQRRSQGQFARRGLFPRSGSFVVGRHKQSARAVDGGPGCARGGNAGRRQG
jgi:hypothetical protein